MKSEIRNSRSETEGNRPHGACLGLDIGGANLKAAHSSGQAWSMPFALWKQPQQLTTQLTQLATQGPAFDSLAVTMTAELCDCFPTKRDGVECVLSAVDALAAGRLVLVWTTDGRFVSTADARRHPRLCAAANWHALATFVASLFPSDNSLLIDTGSTTTDILFLRAGRVEPAGKTDLDRLASGELLYLGAARTPLMALGPSISWQGRDYALMAEWFASSADVMVLLGSAPEQPQNTDTADNRPLTREYSAARIARMIGADLEMIRHDGAIELAHAFAHRMHTRIAAAARRVASSHPPVTRLILSGSGDHLAAVAAAQAFPDIPQIRLAAHLTPAASTAACAYALVQLAAKQTANHR